MNEYVCDMWESSFYVDVWPSKVLFTELLKIICVPWLGSSWSGSIDSKTSKAKGSPTLPLDSVCGERFYIVFWIIFTNKCYYAA